MPALRCRGGAELAERLFAPLGWTVTATPVPLDPALPEWGDSRYVDLTLTGTVRLADALNHLYVLLPVLDDAKHYWVAPDEIDKLLPGRRGLAGRPPGAGADHPPLPGAPARALAEQALDAVWQRAASTDAVDDTEADATDEEAELPAERREPLAAAAPARRCWPRWPRPARPGCSTSAAAAARCSPIWSQDRRYTEIVGADVSHARAGDGRAPAAAGPAARAAARADHADPVGADLPRRPAARVRRGGADGGHRARRPAAAARAGRRGLRPRRARAR